ncbi:hypothetical protein [Nocardioides taihuensis]|uniref:HypC/HybG/HupF family hydrogenase formation chaperone n=1 Tax=Nocardioides taihuensis TaxID=1835606 RepID=A0ABW0BIS8_9ACTN
MELIDVPVTRLEGHEGTVEVSHRAAGCRRGLEFGEVVMLRGGDGQTCLARVADIAFELDDTVYHLEPVVPATVDGLNALLEELDLPGVAAPAPRDARTPDLSS